VFGIKKRTPEIIPSRTASNPGPNPPYQAENATDAKNVASGA
jgi:hypothetical protein